MDDAELVGGVLVGTVDPVTAARELSYVLAGASASSCDFDPHLVDVLRRRLGTDSARIKRACETGAAWVLGRRSVPPGDQWELVASLPTETVLPVGLRRTTAETLVQLVTSANQRVRIVSPFIDWPGLSFLGDSLAAATSRGTVLEIIVPDRSTHAADALAELEDVLRREGDPALYSTKSLQMDAPWAHLKVVTSDSDAAYLGSANVTAAGLGGRNLELGILVTGRTVDTVHALLDMFTTS